MDQKPRLSLDVVSDVVCPWCYVGLRRLEQALAMARDIHVEVRWRPFQLDPTIPAGGIDRKQYMLAKFGDEKRLREIHDTLVGIGRQEGIAFDFGSIKVSPNTLDAHRVIRWAASSAPGTQHTLVQRLFKAYFEEGRDIGAHTVLIAIAADAGMDASVVETLLAAGADAEEVRAEIETAQRMGVSGVPCFLLDAKYAVVGAQEAASLADAFAKVAAAREEPSIHHS